MNNNWLPAGWSFESDLPVTNQKKSLGQDNDIVELLWKNGQVVLQSQTRKPSFNHNDSRQVVQKPKLRGSGSYGNSSNLIQNDDDGDDTVSWVQYPLEVDPFEKEFCYNLFSELPPSDPKEIEQDKLLNKFGASDTDVDATHVIANSHQPTSISISNSVVPEFPGNLGHHPPRFPFPESAAQKNHDLGGPGKVSNFIGSSNGQHGGEGSGQLMQGEVRECSVMTIGSSHSGSNQVPNDPDFSNGVGTSALFAGPVKQDVHKITPQSERRKMDTLEPTVASSSGGSGSSFGRRCTQSTGVNSMKRKVRDAEELECQSEAAELESAAGNKPAQRSASSRRSRSAEVHNLSERRRRDRINEKMKALQELIPHCNEVMWMGSGMAPMMFPGVQRYISLMGMGIGPPPLPSSHNPMHLQRVPPVDQSMSMAPSTNHALMCQTPVLNNVNYQNQMHNPSFSEKYARYMGFHYMQTASQPLHMLRFGSPTIQQSQTTVPPGTSSGHLNGGAAINDFASGMNDG
ncbi:transcription factor pif4 [Quercus suber]|uniref:Transcription factor pif4 n=1 Tax=Quercus suber TaxID=58331 RepID=A0AAW0LRG4_QUESU